MTDNGNGTGAIAPPANGNRMDRRRLAGSGGGSSNLADLLERVLDKGLIIAGDITLCLGEIELLQIKLRLLIASVDRARDMGIDWWRHDPALSSAARASTMPREAVVREAVLREAVVREPLPSEQPMHDQLMQRLERLEKLLTPGVVERQ